MTKAATTEPAVSLVMPTYIVTAACVTIVGEAGSTGVLYQGEAVRPWHRPDGTDMATAATLRQLEADGFITVLGD